MTNNITLIQELYAAFSQGDMGAVLGAFDPRVIWNEAEGYVYAEGNPYVGPQAILEGVFMRAGSDFDHFAVTPHHFHGADDSVIVEGRYTGTFKLTGFQLNAQFAHVYRLINSKIISFQQYTDTQQFARAMAEAE
jgi:ketosteroid isomerase-like protein